MIANNQDKVLLLDPNIRTGFIQDAVAHKERIKRMIAMTDIVKVSDEDLECISDGERFDDLITEWLRPYN